MNKLLVICGPTATGKTQLALHLAKQFNGELLSADSRQVYQGMDIGTGKDVGSSKFKVQSSKLKLLDEYVTNGYYDIDGVRLWGLDIVRPDQKFSVAHYYAFSHIVLADIWRRQKLPIMVGGTGFYIDAVTHPFDTILVGPNEKLRKRLENKAVKELQILLQEKSIDRWSSMNNSDKNNPRRLIRAIEIAEYMTAGKDIVTEGTAVKQPLDESCLIVLTAKKNFLDQKIEERVDARVKAGIVEEIKNLLKTYSWKLPSMQTLGYKEWEQYFEGKTKQEEVIKEWKYNEKQYAKRQTTWFKSKKLQPFDVQNPEYIQKIEKYISAWYTLKT